MGRLALALALGLAFVDEPGPANLSTSTRRPAPRAETGRWSWLADPRSAVLLTLGAAAVLGGGHKLLMGMQAALGRRRVLGGGRRHARGRSPTAAPASAARA